MSATPHCLQTPLSCSWWGQSSLFCLFLLSVSNPDCIYLWQTTWTLCLLPKPTHFSGFRDVQTVFFQGNQKILCWQPQCKDGICSFSLPIMVRNGTVDSRANERIELHQCDLDRQIVTSVVENLQRSTYPQGLKPRPWILLTFHSACCLLGETCSFQPPLSLVHIGYFQTSVLNSGFCYDMSIHVCGILFKGVEHTA